MPNGVMQPCIYSFDPRPDIMAGRRPRSDVASIIGGFTGGLNTLQLRNLGKRHQETSNQVRKLSEGIGGLAEMQYESHNALMKGIGSVYELQTANMHMLWSVDERLVTLSDVAWNVQTYLERKELREDFLGDLKLAVIAFEEALDSIDEIAETHLEYATWLIEKLQGLVKARNVRIEHFKTMDSPSDIKWVKGILDRIDSTHRDFLDRLRGD